MASLAVVTATAGSMLAVAPVATAAEPRQAPVSTIAIEEPFPETPEDLRFAIFEVLAEPDTGQAVRDAAAAALDDGSVEAMLYFLETGHQLAQDEDNRVAIFTILGDPEVGIAVRREAEEALEDNSSEALAYFLETGHQLAQDEDNMFAIFVILGDPEISAALRQAAEDAVSGTPEDRAYFLETGQYEVD